MRAEKEKPLDGSQGVGGGMGKADNGFINPSSGSVKEKILSPALAYARRGWPVLPLWRVEDGHCACGQENCSSPGKHPLVPHGVKEATTDPEVIRSWWRRYPKANIGIATGAVSGLLVVDIDPRHGGSLDGLSFPADAPQVQTGGGGRHIYLAWPEGVERLPKTLPGRPGLDLKGPGGYVVAPPSRHVSGEGYEWLKQPNGRVPDSPLWLLKALRAKAEAKGNTSLTVAQVGDTAAGLKALRQECEELRTTPEGERNKRLNLAAYKMGRLVAAGKLSRETVEARLEDAALEAGLASREIQATIRSGLEAGLRDGPEEDLPLARVRALLAGINPEDEGKAKVRQAVPDLAALSPTRFEEVVEKLAQLGFTKSWLRALRREVAAFQKERKAATTPVEALTQVRRLHPAVDFPNGCMIIGFRVDLPDGGEGLLLLHSDGERVEAHVNPETLAIAGEEWTVNGGTPPRLEERWSLEGGRAFLETPRAPEGLYAEIKAALGKYLDLPTPALGLLAAWAVGTYLGPRFAAFPFLHFFGPKETGKSKTLEALAQLACNPFKGRDITAAALGDTCEALRGTMLIDQAERLGHGDNGTDNLVGLLADSYKKAGGRRRVVQVTKDGRTVLEFSTYGPKAFASTKPLDPDLADRCVRIPMVRTARRLPDLEGWEPIWRELRDRIYRWALLRFPAVAAAYQGIPGDGTRMTELWRPLGAVLRALEVGPEEYDTVRGFFMSGAMQTRHEPTPWEARLLEVLVEKAEAADHTLILSVREILELMDIEGPGAKWVGDTLAQYSLFTEKRRSLRSGTKETLYTFDCKRVKTLGERYLREAPLENDCPICPPDKNDNNINDIYWTHAKAVDMSTPVHSPGQNGKGKAGVDTTGHVHPQMTCPPQKPENPGRSGERTGWTKGLGGAHGEHFHTKNDALGPEPMARGDEVCNGTVGVCGGWQTNTVDQVDDRDGSSLFNAPPGGLNDSSPGNGGGKIVLSETGVKTASGSENAASRFPRRLEREKDNHLTSQGNTSSLSSCPPLGREMKTENSADSDSSSEHILGEEGNSRDPMDEFRGIKF